MPSISSVSGTIAHGEAVVISGSDFGTRAHAGPAVYDDFDRVSNGTNITTIEPLLHQGAFSGYDLWGRSTGTDGSAPSNIVSSTSSPKARSTAFARATFSDVDWYRNALLIDGDAWGTGDERYISFYYRFTKTDAGDLPRQVKAWLALDLSGETHYHSTAFDTCEGGGWRLHRSHIPSDTMMDFDGPDINGEWFRIESWVKQSGNNVANGAWEQCDYRPTLGTPSKHTATLSNVVMRESAEEPDWWQLGGGFWDECTSTDRATIDIDEVVFDTSRARVELANASTWAARTFSEYQVATAWADGEVTVTLNAGHHGDSDTAWLYVIKSDGTVNSNGFEVTLGGEGGGGGSRRFYSMSYARTILG